MLKIMIEMPKANSEDIERRFLRYQLR